jgi:hypothetical protein
LYFLGRLRSSGDNSPDAEFGVGVGAADDVPELEGRADAAELTLPATAVSDVEDDVVAAETMDVRSVP